MAAGRSLEEEEEEVNANAEEASVGEGVVATTRPIKLLDDEDDADVICAANGVVDAEGVSIIPLLLPSGAGDDTIADCCWRSSRYFWKSS